MIVTATLIADTLRFAVSIAALAALTAVWYVVVTRVTPFPGTSGPRDPDRPPGEERYPRLQRFTIRADVILFIWVVVEGMIVIPFMLIKYGLH
jgi:hypothetical protein